MTLISIVFCLILDRFFDGVERFRKTTWLKRYWDFFQKKLGKQTPQIQWAVPLVVGVIAVGVIQLMLHDVFFNIPLLCVDIAVLLFCMGSMRLDSMMQDIMTTLEEKGLEAANTQASALLGISPSENEDALRYRVIRTLWQKAMEHFFAVAFWFILLGITGALLYRTLLFLRTESVDVQWNGRAIILMEAIPVRLVALSFALMGNFDAVIRAFRPHSFKQMHESSSVYFDCGDAALGFGNEESLSEAQQQAALEMINRVVLLWVVLVSMSVFLYLL